MWLLLPHSEKRNSFVFCNFICSKEQLHTVHILWFCSALLPLSKRRHNPTLVANCDVWVGFAIWHTAIRLKVTLCYMQAQSLGVLGSRSFATSWRVQPNQQKQLCNGLELLFRNTTIQLIHNTTLYKYQSTYIQALPPLWDRHNYYSMYSLSYGLELIRPIRYKLTYVQCKTLTMTRSTCT